MTPMPEVQLARNYGGSLASLATEILALAPTMQSLEEFLLEQLRHVLEAIESLY